MFKMKQGKFNFPIEKKKKQGDTANRRSGFGITLTPAQSAIFDLVMDGESVFFTGCAGSGKTAIINILTRSLPLKSTFITAATGLAAVHIGGSTLHSFAGIGLGDESKEKMVEKIIGNKWSQKKWLDCRTLIIDEISMVSGELFDKLEHVARAVRGSLDFFGGIQLVISGDFLQLPPVDPSKTEHLAFESEAWKRGIKNVKLLTEIHRQSESSFVKVLNNMRLGKISEMDLDILRPCINRVFDPNDIFEPTRLYATKDEVLKFNTVKLNELEGKEYRFDAEDKGDNKYWVDYLKKYCMAVDSLVLKKNAQVLLIKNLDAKKGLVNGSRGIIIGFDIKDNDEDEKKKIIHPIVRFANGLEQIILRDSWEIKSQGKTVATRVQTPLILAWSLTIHKCQGMTLEKGEVSMTRIFEKNQAYTALSRFKSLESLRITDWAPDTITTCRKAQKFYEDLAKELSQVKIA